MELDVDDGEALFVCKFIFDLASVLFKLEHEFIITSSSVCTKSSELAFMYVDDWFEVDEDEVDDVDEEDEDDDDEEDGDDVAATVLFVDW